MMSKKDKQNNKSHEKFCGGKIVSPAEMLCLLRKNEYNRMWILKQLSQLGINIDILQQYSLSQLYKHCGEIIRSTYSIKYFGLNENEMGIISRRIDPFKENNFRLTELPQSPYIINKFFFPKPLKVGRKFKKNQQINLNNLQLQIKKAFIKEQQPPVRPKTKLKSKIHGSWINTSSNKKDVKQSDNKLKLNSSLQHGQKNGQEQQEFSEFQEPNLKMMNHSYSRFLSSGLLFSTIDALC